MGTQKNRLNEHPTYDYIDEFENNQNFMIFFFLLILARITLYKAFDQLFLSEIQ